jgi:hypothetical protein
MAPDFIIHTARVIAGEELSHRLFRWHIQRHNRIHRPFIDKL